MLATSAQANEFSDDLAARRSRIMDKLGPDTLLLLRSAPSRTYSLDVDYEYRQDSNLYYLTGLTQPDTALVLMPGNASRREILFVKPRDSEHEHWNGRLLSHEEAGTQTGIRTVMTTAQFEPFLEAMLNRQRSGSITAAEAHSFFDALAAGRARVALALESRYSERCPWSDRGIRQSPSGAFCRLPGCRCHTAPRRHAPRQDALRTAAAHRERENFQ